MSKWHVEKDPLNPAIYVVKNEEDFYVAYGIESEAKAVLIAAAPELLEACDTTLLGVTKDADSNDGKVDREGLAQTVHEAMASARGEQPV